MNGFRTKTGFDPEAKGNSEMAYYNVLFHLISLLHYRTAEENYAGVSVIIEELFRYLLLLTIT